MTKVIVDQAARDKITQDLHTNFLVEAGAGSGKTTSLVDRMVNLIHSGTCRIEELVAITFTRKAADELKTRFQTVLEKKKKEATGPDTTQRLEDALQNIDRSFLGTVHAFCAQLLRERPVEANLDLSFKELEESDDAELLEEAWQLFLQEVQESNPARLHELDELGVPIDSLLKNFRDIREYPDVVWVVDHTVEKPELRPAYEALMVFVHEAKRAIPDEEPDKGYDKLQATIVDAIQREKHLNPSRDRDLLDLLERFDKSLSVTQNRWSSKEDAKYYRDTFKDFVDSEIRPLLVKWREYCHPKITAFLKDAMTTYTRLKEERSLLNFQDLLIKTAELLKGNPEVRAYFQAKYRHLLVDEFQDTDPIQAEIMFYLSGEDHEEENWTKCVPRPGSLFVVGDPKQAIYRFRRADIDTYNRVKSLIQDHGGEVLQLTMNFRTLDTVTSKLNEVFVQHLPETETEYQAAYRPLDAYKEDDGSGFSGIHLLTVPAEYTKKDDVVKKDAEQIAETIRTLIGQGFAPRDFLVLNRYNEGVATYAQTIEDAGLPVSVSGEIIIGETLEFQELLSLLKVFVDPTDSVHFTAALRGMLFGISDNDLYQWKRAGGRFSIYSPIPDELAGDVRGKFEIALTKLQSYQKAIRSLPPTAAIEQIIEDVGFYPILAANGRSKREAKSLMQIMEALRKQEANGKTTYQDIYQSFSEMVLEKTTVANMEEDADAIRVMNVHKAKGLEAPIVFLAHPKKQTDPEKFTSRHIKREDRHSKGYFTYRKPNGPHHEKEIAIPPDWETYKAEELQYLTEEETRIIYVAATRAEKALLISSSAKSDKQNPWGILLDGIGGLEELPASEPATDDGEKAEVAEVTKGDYEAATSGLNDWIEGRKTKSYDTWSPTEHKDYAEVLNIEREQGGGKEWGTVIHEVFEQLVRGHEINTFITSTLRRHSLPVEREKEVWEAIQSFQHSDIWEALQSAETVFHEVPFTFQVEEDDPLYPEITESEASPGHPIIVKGVIDLLYKTEEGWHIVDYKTDRVKEQQDLRVLEEYYGKQIAFYKKAWEKMTREQVVSTRLFFTQV